MKFVFLKKKKNTLWLFWNKEYAYVFVKFLQGYPLKTFLISKYFLKISNYLKVFFLLNRFFSFFQNHPFQPASACFKNIYIYNCICIRVCYLTSSLRGVMVVLGVDDHCEVYSLAVLYARLKFSLRHLKSIILIVYFPYFLFISSFISEKIQIQPPGEPWEPVKINKKRWNWNLIYYAKV